MEARTETLAEFLLARIAEDEESARSAPGNRWHSFPEDSVAGASVYDEQWVLLYPEHYDHDRPLSNEPGATGPQYIQRARDEMVDHIARHDPARVLAECEAKRRIVEPARDVLSTRGAYASYADDTMLDGMALTYQAVLRVLAQPYADHPDFREEWRVE